MYHIDRLLEVLARDAPEMLAWLCVVCLDRPGPDTDQAVARWLRDHPTLLVASCPQAIATLLANRDRERYITLDPEIFDQHIHCCRALAALVRPGGLLLQDIQLETLAFIPRDRWWESIFLASGIRGTFAERPPTGRFLSNKRGYAATFGCDLIDAGFDPRDVLDKDDLDHVMVPVLRRFLEQSMPFRLRALESTGSVLETCLASADRTVVEASLDLVLWPTESSFELGGRAIVAAGRRARVRLKRGCPEVMTWLALVADRLGSHTGLAVRNVGRRIAPEHAGRAEITNCAARHIHALRARLANGGKWISTVDHTYRLNRACAIGLVERLQQPPGISTPTPEVAQ